jgi:hypothetical protein
MGEQARLRHSGRVGEGADGQAVEARLAHQAQGFVEDGSAGALTFRLDGARLDCALHDHGDEE